MKQPTTIGLDIAKDVFQIHGAASDGSTIFNRKVQRSELLHFFEKLSPCTIAIEACGTAHHWARTIQQFGHDVRLIHPSYVKPFVKRGKTDANDAEAINEALSRKTMRFVPVKSADQQASGLSFRVRSLLVRQRAQLSNALRSQLAEFGIITASDGFTQVIAMTERALNNDGIPEIGHFALKQLVDQINSVHNSIAQLERQIKAEAKKSDAVKRLMTIPGVGPLTAMAIMTLAPAADTFKSSRHFAAWVGLTPKNYSSGGNHSLGAVSKMGNKQLRTLLVIGAISVMKVVKPDDQRMPWLARLKQRRPYRVAAVALANKTARTIWALLTSGESYQPPRNAIGASVSST